MIAKTRQVIMLAALFMLFCGCANVDYQALSKNTIERNSLALGQTSLQKRMEASGECNVTGKSIDALASYGYFSFVRDGEVVVREDVNVSVIDESSSALSIYRLYERGYKLEAKRKAMELLASSKASFAILMVMARIYEAEGDYRGSTLFYLDALNFEPKNESANYALARLYYMQKKPKQAMRHAKIALQADGLESKNISELIVKIEKMKSGDDNE